MLDAFYGMQQGRSESTAEFILRVEDKQLQLGIDERTCFRYFTPLLDEEERARLDAVRELTVTMGGCTEDLLTWESLTARARFGAQCTKLAPGRNNLMISGFDPQLVAEADPGVASVVQVPAWKTGSVSGKQLYRTHADLQAAAQGGGQYGR